MRDYWRLGGLIYRELVVQAITQSRRTGARPTRIERVVDGYRVIKVVASIMMIMYLASPAITSALLRWRDPASIFVFPPYDYLTMYFTILLIYMLLSPLAISVMGNTTTGGELLRILGFSERRIRLVSIIAVVRAVDAPLLTAMVLAITASIILRTPTPIIITTQAVLLGLMGPLLSVLALDTVISRGGSASGLWTRAFMVITNTATWVIALALLMLSEASPQLINPGIAQYIPLVGDPLIGRYAAALVNSVVTMTILLIIDAYLMGSAGTRLLMPRTPGGPESLITKRKPLGGFRFRGPVPRHGEVLHEACTQCQGFPGHGYWRLNNGPVPLRIYGNDDTQRPIKPPRGGNDRHNDIHIPPNGIHSILPTRDYVQRRVLRTAHNTHDARDAHQEGAG
ncbi:hypothetical protein [Vulcanisaeta souniana]|uniref:hypothetical protein n=1 Tax=Vulcanisaeta souniana TaxID=164452 RepID=UPI0006D0B3F4|nr:hypothetical protein [Vulcanisaeta souniana]